MKITKGAAADRCTAVTDDDLSRINEFAKSKLAAEDVFTFSVLLCDNEVDRDNERFTIGALEKLGELFVGKTGISDHEWSAKGQKARIYRTEVVTDAARVTSCGEAYTYLKAYAYMLRTEGNAELIAEIEGGIKKEVSVGCSVSETLCSICGGEIGSAECGHIRGREYDGRTCCAILSEPTDAYEWSFVAVPAQRDAGIIKRFSEAEGEMTLAGFIEKCGNKAFGDEFSVLCREAEIGRRAIADMRREVVRLGLLSDCGMSAEILESAVSKLDEKELLGFRDAFSARVDEILPPVTQLGAKLCRSEHEPESEFII